MNTCLCCGHRWDAKHWGDDCPACDGKGFPGTLPDQENLDEVGIAGNEKPIMSSAESLEPIAGADNPPTSSTPLPSRAVNSGVEGHAILPKGATDDYSASLWSEARLVTDSGNQAPPVHTPSDLIQKTEYVAGFMFRQNGSQVALVRKRKGGDFQVGKLNGIGGKIEPGELPSRAMIREFLEETDCGTSVCDWREFCKLEGKNCIVYFFVYLNGDGLAVRTVEEEEIAWYDVASALGQCVPNLRWLIPMALDKDKVRSVVEDLRRKYEQ